MKIVFLDFDGVLNSHAYQRGLLERGEKVRSIMGIDPVAVRRLNRLLKATGALVVVSSTWRLHRTRIQLCDVLSAEGFEGQVRGMTPALVQGGSASCRGEEIQAWLEEASEVYVEDVDSFVILDDDDDMGHLASRLVKTTFAEGLRDEDVDLAIGMLNS